MALVDKSYIHQTDERSENAGILNLAGFLAHTNHLVISWSPRFFTRFWWMNLMDFMGPAMDPWTFRLPEVCGMAASALLAVMRLCQLSDFRLVVCTTISTPIFLFREIGASPI